MQDTELTTAGQAPGADDVARRVELERVDEDSTSEIYVGQLRTDEAQQQFVGTIDEFALYDRALSAEQVSRHYHLVQREGRWE